MLLPWIGFLALLAFVPALLFFAHMFALSRQDKTAWFVVFLDSRVGDVAGVAERQAARYKLIVERTFDSSVKGYTALIPISSIERLKADRRVVRLDQQEPPEF